MLPDRLSDRTSGGFVTRFAPSPTGYLHLGHAYSARTAFDAATAAGGRFILRIEDIDRGRCRAEYETAVYEDLAWLGLRWETLIRRQSEHMADYEAALDRLRDMGVLYRCFRTRREVAERISSAPHGPTKAFMGQALTVEEEAARLSNGEAFAWRLSVDRARERLGERFDKLTYHDADLGVQHPDPERAGDVILARKDVGVAYHLACVVDDALQGVTHVIRGEDLSEAMHPQRLLQALLDLPTPVYRHHPLLLDRDGKRLAKRNGSTSLRDLRATGMSRDEVWLTAGFDGPPAASR